MTALNEPKTRKRTHPIVETSAHSLSVDPYLPFSGFTIPTLTCVIPFVQPQWVVQTVESVAFDCHGEIAGSLCICYPGVDGTWLSVH